jgi:hypothetical protein
MTTIKDARRLFKTCAALKYRGSKQIVLRTLIEATFRGKDRIEADITGRPFTIKAADLCKAAGGIKDQQLMNIISSLDEIELTGREDGKITYRLDLKPLEDAEPSKAEQERLKRERTEKARQKKAEQRAAKREPDYDKMNVFEIVQHGIKLFEQEVASIHATA